MDTNSNTSEKKAPKNTMFGALAAAGGSVAAAVGTKGRNLYDRISAGRRRASDASDEAEGPAFDLKAYKAPVQSAQGAQSMIVSPPHTQTPKDRSQPE